jgi:hypothetical protein
MDERLRNIRELESQKKQASGDLDVILEELGRLLYEADPEAEPDYSRLLSQIEGAKKSLDDIAADEKRLVELDEEVRNNSGEDAEQAKRLPGLYKVLGKDAIEDESVQAFVSLAGFRNQRDTIRNRIGELEEKLSDVSATKFWNKVAKGAQDLVNKPLLQKSKADLEKLYGYAGEQFSEEALKAGEVSEGLRSSLDEINWIKRRREELSGDIQSAREEKKRINRSYAEAGGTKKKAESLQTEIKACEAGLVELYRKKAGSLVSAQASDGLDEEEKQLFDQAADRVKIIDDADSRIAHLKALIALEEEQAQADKLGRNIETEEAKLRDLKAKLQVSKKHIEELQQQL